jgi:hypothetical protein
MPIISDNVNMELTSGLPNSVPGGEIVVYVQRLRVERHVGEPHVVGFRHGAAHLVLQFIAVFQLVEPLACHCRLPPV